MANIINAITTGAGGLSTTADASGNIDFKSNGTTVASITSTGLNVVGTFTNNGSPINVSGGATTTSSAVDITLTSSSNRVQNVSMTAASKTVILPDATTLTTGGPIFIINNTGYAPFYIKLNTGVITHILASGTQIQLSLTDNSTAQGQWSSQVGPISFGNYVPALVDTNPIQGGNSSGNINLYAGMARAANQVDNSLFVVQPLTSTTMFLAWMRIDKSIYGCVATNTSGTLSFGTIVQIYNGATTNAISLSGRMLSSTAGIVVVDRGTNAIAVPITISGTTVSVGTASSTFGATQSLANSTSTVTQALMPLSSTLLGIVYSTGSTTIVVNTITHNGASAPTIGTASTGITITAQTSSTGVTLSSTTAQIFYIKAATSTSTSSGTRVVTFSGSSAPTLGTELTTYNNASYNLIRGIAYSSTETAFLLGDGASTYSLLSLSYTISGTTVTLQKVGSMIGVNSGDAGQALGQIQNFASAGSTTYITSTGINVGGAYLSKWTYVPGDSLQPSITNQTHLITNKAFNGGAITQGASSAIAYNYSGKYSTANTISPTYGCGGVAMFSGSSTTGIILGAGTDYTSTGNSNASSNLYIMAQVFTIL